MVSRIPRARYLAIQRRQQRRFKARNPGVTFRPFKRENEKQ